MAPTLTPRQSFRDVLAQAAAQARAILPPAVNGRIESAVRLVLQADVVFNTDGTATVGSSSDPMKTYTLAGAACDCQDFAYGKAPDGWCQHKIAANLQRSVERVLARRAAPELEPEVEMPVDFEPFPDNDAEETPMPPTPAPCVREARTAPLPEAPASVNVRVTIQGREVQWTLRDTDEARLAVRLEALLARYPVPLRASSTHEAPAPAARPQVPAVQGQGAGWCAVHNTAMQANEKNGQRWFSHRLPEGSFCKGRR
jgi:hypothetical protein